MSTPVSTVLVFPGQGAYRPGALAELVDRSASARAAVEQVEAAALRLGAEGLQERVLAAPTEVEVLRQQAPDVLQLALYATAVAVHATLQDELPAPFATVGHSLGEIAAMVAGGALSLASGTQVVVQRGAVLRALSGPTGAMVALACDTERAQMLLDLVEDPQAAVAAENGPQLTVVSGPATAMRTVSAVAAAVHVTAVDLPAPYAFHSPLLAGAVTKVQQRIAGVEQTVPLVPVFSPTLGRFVRADDDLSRVVSSALVSRVRFGSAVTRLARAGATEFVECATSATLSRAVQRLLPEASVRCAHTPGAVAPAGTAHAPAPIAARHAPQPQPSAAPEPVLPVVTQPAPTLHTMAADRDALFADLRRLYAEALEYPEEVFTESVALEADLGVDSVKQTELLGRAAERYGLPARPPEFRLADYDTMGRLVDWVWSATMRTDEAA